MGQQTGITEFFSVTGVISSSPQKDNKTPVKDEEQHKTPVKEEEELAAPLDSKDEDLTEDFMEGITEDMFDEDMFDEVSVKKEKEFLVSEKKEVDEEYPVDGLPDAHYGLLGVQGGDAVPQGHVQDLPDEILRTLFGHLPAEDLYRHISLVCQRWRIVAMDPQVCY